MGLLPFPCDFSRGRLWRLDVQWPLSQDHAIGGERPAQASWRARVSCAYRRRTDQPPWSLAGRSGEARSLSRTRARWCQTLLRSVEGHRLHREVGVGGPRHGVLREVVRHLHVRWRLRRRREPLHGFSRPPSPGFGSVDDHGRAGQRPERQRPACGRASAPGRRKRSRSPCRRAVSTRGRAPPAAPGATTSPDAYHPLSTADRK
jgi:hypothetical protein